MSGEGLIAEPRAVHGSEGHEKLRQLMHRGTEFLGCDIAIMGGAMSWVSERHLVSAISNAGGFGVIACGAMTPELLDTEIAETRARTDRPFGVNLITMHPMLSDLIDVCAKHHVGHVVLAGGLPPGGAIDRIKSSGAKLICFAPALSLAKKLTRSGADALVIEGMEAGGHIGPVSTSVLAQEILPHIAHDMPVFVAGGIGRGEAIAAYLEMGAVGVQLGTRFVCAHESIAHPNFKKAFIRASARDAIPSVQIDPRLPVIPVRALRNQEMVNFAGQPLYKARTSSTVAYPLRQGLGQEQDLYDQVTAYCEIHFDRAKQRNRSAAGLAMSILQRRLASSTWALFSQETQVRTSVALLVSTMSLLVNELKNFSTSSMTNRLSPTIMQVAFSSVNCGLNV